MPRDRRPYLLLPLVAFVAIVPLLVYGCSCGHDFDFHIVSWMEAARQFLHGNLQLHWAYTAAYNTGEPRFVFYPPLSWTLGAILGIAMPWTWTPIVYTWLALTAAGCSLYYLAKDFATPTASLLAATFYIVNPYMLFTAYERTAYAELLAAAWIPLLLHAILRDRVTIPRIAIPIALLWMTNAPAAVMGCYALVLLTALRLITAKRGTSRTDTMSSVRLVLNTMAGTLLGLALAAFYILPAAYERRYVQIAMALLPGERIQDNFIFHRVPVAASDPFHDAVLHTASVVAALLILLTFAAILLRYLQDRKPGSVEAKHAVVQRLPAILALFAIAIVFLLTSLSGPIWNHAPELNFLQFPWRLLAILAAALSLVIALVLSHRKVKPGLTATVAIVIVGALIASAYIVFRQECDDPDTVQARLAVFRSNSGSDPTDEYTPLAADNDVLGQKNPGYWLTQNPTAPAPPDSVPAPAPTQLSLNVATPQNLILNLRNYPNWRVTRNGAIVKARLQRADGLMAIPLPAGPSNLVITYIDAPDQILGDALTVLAFIVLLFLLCPGLRRRNSTDC